MANEPEQVKALTLALHEKQATLELLKRFPDVAVYGLLLNSDLRHPLVQVVKEHWSEIHHLTGSNIFLVAFQPPAEWSGSLENFWKQKLGDSFKKMWKDWQTPLDPGVAFDYLDLFESPEVKPSQLPCLVLFTNLQKRDAVVRSLPNWDADSLYRLLLGMLEDVRECTEQPADLRLECLRDSLTSPRARALDCLGHIRDRAIDYLKKHPAEVVVTTISIVMALGTAQVLPLSAGVIGVLTVAKDAFSKSK
jgi:hypothetical protein